MNFWINCQVHYQFQVFINQLDTFYQICGKGKQNRTFIKIAELCHAAYDLLFQADFPKEDPGPSMANLSGGLQTQLDILIDTKEGSENSDLFTKHHGNTKTTLKEFTLIFKEYLKQYDADPEKAKKSFKEMQALLIPLEMLQNKINSLNIYRKENNDPFTLFKRSVHYSSKSMAGAGVLISASIFTALLSIIDHTIGPAMDNYLDQRIEKNLDYKDIVAMIFFASALILLIRALVKNYRSHPKLIDNIIPFDNNISLKNVTEINMNDSRVIDLEEDDNKRYSERSLLLN